MAVAEQLQRLHRASPFLPFVLLLKDGRALRVTDPALVAQRGGGAIIITSATDDSFEVIDFANVVSLALLVRGYGLRNVFRRLWVWLLLVVFVGGAAAANVPVAKALNPAGTRWRLRGLVSERGDAAAGRTWQGPTPHTEAWPPVTLYSEAGRFGYRAMDMRAVNWETNKSTHSMSVERFGWPLSCVETVRRWWPWDDPRWKLTTDPDMPPRLLALGLVVNPVLIGGAFWLFLVVAPLAWVQARRVKRMRRGGCPVCAYDLRGDLAAGCPECGWNRGANATAAGKSH